LTEREWAMPLHLRAVAAVAGAHMKPNISDSDEGMVAAIYLTWLFALEKFEGRHEQAAAAVASLASVLTDGLLHEDLRMFEGRPN